MLALPDWKSIHSSIESLHEMNQLLQVIKNELLEFLQGLSLTHHIYWVLAEVFTNQCKDRDLCAGVSPLSKCDLCEYLHDINEPKVEDHLWECLQIFHCINLQHFLLQMLETLNLASEISHNHIYTLNIDLYFAILNELGNHNLIDHNLGLFHPLHAFNKDLNLFLFKNLFM